MLAPESAAVVVVVFEVQRAGNGHPGLVRLAGQRVEIGRERIADARLLAEQFLRRRAVLPRLAIAMIAVRPEHRAHGSELGPPDEKLLVDLPAEKSADIVRPVHRAEIAGPGGELDLVLKHVPFRRRVAGELDGISMRTHPTPASKDDPALVRFLLGQLEVDAVRPKLAVRAGKRRLDPAVDPPEIHALGEQRPQENITPRLHRRFARPVARPLALVRERAEPLLDLRDVAVVRRQCVILIIARVIVQRRLHPEVVQRLHGLPRIREELLVPIVPAPPAAPVRVNDHHIDGDVVLAIALHEVNDFRVGVRVPAGIPESERPARHHGNRPENGHEILQRAPVIVGVGEEVTIELNHVAAAFRPVVFVVPIHLRIVADKMSAVRAQDSLNRIMLGPAAPLPLIQRTRHRAEIAAIALAGRPHHPPARAVPMHDLQVLGRKDLSVVDVLKLEFGRAERQRFSLSDHFRRRGLRRPSAHEKRRSRGELSSVGELEPDAAFGVDGEASITLDNGCFLGGHDEPLQCLLKRFTD